MPRFDGRGNLVQNNKNFSEEQKKDIWTKGGKNSGESKRAVTSITEALKKQLDEDTLMEITSILIKKAKMGNLKAYELVRDQMGEKPTEKVAVSTINDDAIENLKKAIEERRSNV